MLVLCHAFADPNAQFEYGLFGSTSHVHDVHSHSAAQGECKVEMVTIVRTNCKVEFDEECTTEEKVVGDRVTYDKECEEKEVEECKPVHYIPRFVDNTLLNSTVMFIQQIDLDWVDILILLPSWTMNVRRL